MHCSTSRTLLKNAKHFNFLIPINDRIILQILFTFRILKNTDMIKIKCKLLNLFSTSMLSTIQKLASADKFVVKQ